MKPIVSTLIALSSGLSSGCLAAQAQDAAPVLSAGVRTARQPQSWQKTVEGLRWIRAVSTQLQNRVPSWWTIDPGEATVLFRVDRDGKIVDVRVTQASTKEHAALVHWIFDQVNLPPPPPAVAKVRECCSFSQKFVVDPPLRVYPQFHPVPQ